MGRWIDLREEAAHERAYCQLDYEAGNDPSCNRAGCHRLLLARTGDFFCAGGHHQLFLVDRYELPQERVCAICGTADDLYRIAGRDLCVDHTDAWEEAA